MNDKYALLATGFLIAHDQSYLTQLTKDKLEIKNVINTVTAATTTGTLHKFVSDNSVFYSEQANAAYDAYNSNKCFETYMTLVNLATDLLVGIEYKAFMEIQAGNKFLSPTGYMFCLSCIGKTLDKDRTMYDILPASSRFIAVPTVTNEDIARNVSRVRRALSGAIMGNRSWVDEISSLSRDQATFVSFFRFMFVTAF